MQWKGRRESDNVQDVRGERVGGLGGGRIGGGGLGLLNMIVRLFGIKGIFIAAILGVILWKAGIIDPLQFLGGGAPSTSQGPVKSSPEEEERLKFVKVVMADTEEIWTKEFQRIGKSYQLPQMKVYKGKVRTGCGMGSAEQGPFYCPADLTVYIDLSFYDELAKTFQSPGDFAQAYVVAHEVGHHVQKLLGASDFVASKQRQSDYNEYSVRLELQADFYAGVWANKAQQHLDSGDIEEAIRAANAIGDDAIQKKMQGRVVPHTFTHGTSEQRMRWFMKGFKSGRIEDGDTFSMPYSAL